MIKTEVQNRSKVKAAIRKAFKELDIESNVLVGVLADAGIHPTSAAAGNDTTIAQVGAFHQFGTGREQRWLSIGVENALPDIASYLESVQKKVAAGREVDTDKILGDIGMMSKNSVQQYITDIDLIYTGQLKQHIHYELSDEPLKVAL